MSIKKYLRRRKVRKLAEKCLAGQNLYSADYLQSEMVNNAIQTAEKFYEVWNSKE